MSVESEVRASVNVGDLIPTPSGRSQFAIADITEDSITILIEARKARQVIAWSLLEETLRETRRMPGCPLEQSTRLQARTGRSRHS